MNPANGNSTSRAQDPPILSREDWTVPDNYSSITGPQDLPLPTWNGWWVRGLTLSDLERCRQIWSLAILQGGPRTPPADLEGCGQIQLLRILPVGPTTDSYCSGMVQIASTTGKSINGCWNPLDCPRKVWIALPTRKFTRGCWNLSHCSGRVWISPPPPTKKSVSRGQELPHYPESGQKPLITRKFESGYQDPPHVLRGHR